MFKRANRFGACDFWLIPALAVLVLLLLFFPILFQGKVLAFRDAANWYGPTHQWTAQILQNGQFPLWNDLQGIGTNWVGQGTTTVFYPGTWLLSLPIGSFHQRFAFVLILHFLVCFLNTFFAARKFHLSRFPALLTAVSYTFSVPNIAGHNNWPFLISSTWLPLAIAGLWMIRQRNGYYPVFLTSISLSLTLLGGDPQSVYHFGLLAIVLILFQFRRLSDPQISIKSIIGRLLLTFVLTVSASLIQLWPTWEVSRESVRAIQKSQPRSLGTDEDAWLDRAETEFQKLEKQKLQFSQPPWHLGTLIYGNLFGTTARFHSRWDKQIPASDRLWNPNLYQGALPCFFGLAALCWFRKKNSSAARTLTTEHQVLQRWLFWCFLLFSTGSFGWYGIGWILNESFLAIGMTEKQNVFQPESGGIYWLLSFLPGYGNFRYPAKLWVFASFALAVLSGVFFQAILKLGRNDVHQSSRLSRRLALLVAISGILMIVFSSPAVAHLVQSLRYSNPQDYWIGPFRPQSAFTESQVSILHTIIVCSFAALLFAMNSKTALSDRRKYLKKVSVLIVSFTLLELAFAGNWTIIAIQHDGLLTMQKADSPNDQLPHESVYFDRRKFWQKRAELLGELQKSKQMQLDESPLSFHQLQQSTVLAMAETRHPQFHLLSGTRSVNAFQTLYPASIYLLELLSKTRPTGGKNFPAYLKSVGVRVKDSEASLSKESPSQSALVEFADRWEVRVPPENPSFRSLLMDQKEVWISETGKWKPIEDGVTLDAEPKFHSPQTKTPEDQERKIRVAHYDKIKNGELKIDVTCPQKTIVVIKRQFDAGWKAKITDKNTQESWEQNTIRINRTFCGIAIPPGEFSISLSYRPRWFWLGGTITIVTWLGLIVSLIFSVKKKF